MCRLSIRNGSSWGERKDLMGKGWESRLCTKIRVTDPAVLQVHHKGRLQVSSHSCAIKAPLFSFFVQLKKGSELFSDVFFKSFSKRLL